MKSAVTAAAVSIAGVLFVVVFVLGIALTGGALDARAQALGTVGVGQGLKPGVIPAEYEPLINQAAQTCPEITAPLLAAQMQKESNWNPTARSSASPPAQGIAQFMPATWPSWGRDENGNGRASPDEPADAIPAQARYMCAQVVQVRAAKIPGDVIDLALASYNAGFGKVEAAQGIPRISETQNYVRAIRGLTAQLAQAPPAGGDGIIAGGWTVPTQGRCTSGFGSRWGENHHGQDLAGPIGTPIVAGAGGTVSAAGPASGYGQWVKIDHGSGVETTYGHVDTYAVQVGQPVQPGQPIATVGNRGQSTGPHLHFQIETNDQPVDPVAYYQSHGAPPLCG